MWTMKNKIKRKFKLCGKAMEVEQSILKKKNKVEGITPPEFKTYYKATLINTVCIGERIDTWANGKELRPELDSIGHINMAN